MPLVTYRQMIRDTFDEMLAKDPKIFLMGVGLSDPSACFGTLSGLYQKYPKRVFDTPICEATLTGMCLGAALAGMKPVLIHHRINFAFLGMDQIVNHIAIWKSMFGLEKELPILIRGTVGEKGWGNGYQHLGTYRETFENVIHTVVPTCPNEARFELLDWWKYPKPTVFIDQKKHHDDLALFSSHPNDSYTRIPDPYPQETLHKRFPDQRPKMDISIHQAWADGYEYAMRNR